METVRDRLGREVYLACQSVVSMRDGSHASVLSIHVTGDFLTLLHVTLCDVDPVTLNSTDVTGGV